MSAIMSSPRRTRVVNGLVPTMREVVIATNRLLDLDRRPEVSGLEVAEQRLEAFMTVMEAEASEEERYQRLLALLEGIRSVLGATNDAEDPRVHEALKRLRRSLTAYEAETYIAETEEG
jgi:hypothetical protein